MAIDAAEVRRIAALAKLEVPDDEIERVAAQLSSVLDFVAALGELDLAGCEPAVLAPAGAPPRADEPGTRTFGDAATATSGAAESEDGFFLVPPVVENLEP